MNIKEFQIPVPWGYVAAKAWGDEADTPVLAVHGLSDNAGSFDRLLPHLPPSFYYICIDLPSHGKSSPFPPNLLISSLDNVLTFKIVVDYLNRKKYILMGHSWGGQTAVLFTQVYPQYVLKIILLDAFYLYPLRLDIFRSHITNKISILLRVNKNIAKNKRPSYTYDKAVSTLIDNRMWDGLSRDAGEALIKRSLVPVGDGKFEFTTDPRLKAFIDPLFSPKYVTQLAKTYPLTCPILFIYASESIELLSRFREFIGEVRKRNKRCKIERVIGSHDVHNNSPEIVAPIICEFLTNVKSKL